MAGITIRKMLDKIEPFIYNPVIVNELVLDSLLAVNADDSIEILDPSNPVTYVIESGILVAQSTIEFVESTYRNVYPKMAITTDELLNHMSDVDHLNRFSVPVNTYWTLLIGLDELRKKAVPLNSTGTRKLIIPRDTEFTVAGYTFTMQYAVELQILGNGGVRAVYSTTTDSPIASMASNLLDWQIVTMPYDNVAVETLLVKIPVYQYAINSNYDTIVSGLKFKRTYNFNNKFYYIRVWQRYANEWVELATTHSVKVVDIYTPTAVITVGDGTVGVYIPDVYIKNKMVGGDIRVDIYTTNGNINIDMRNYAAGDCTRKLRDLSESISSDYYSPLANFQYLLAYCDQYVTGGKSGLGFKDLRDRVINNSLGRRKIPITEQQLNTALADLGFSVTPSVDYVTERIFHATANMPDSTISTVSTPVGTVNGIIETSYKALTALSSVRDNGDRITITPDTIYQYVDGAIEPLSQPLGYYNALTAGERVELFNSGRYLYTPFHYVLDDSDGVFSVRAYYLDAPDVTAKQFISTNSTLSLDVSISAYSLSKVTNGYRLLVAASSGDTYKELEHDDARLQISFTPRNYSGVYAYLDGTLLGVKDDERVWEFIIETNFDLDKNHDLIVTNFTFLSDVPTDVPMQLDAAINVIFSVANNTSTSYRASAIDDVLRGDNGRGITHELLSLQIGNNLPMLWANARNVAGTIEYARYDHVVYDTWGMNVPKRDEKKLPVLYTDENGKLAVEYLHRKGDYKLDADGNKIVKCEIGSIIYDAAGSPVIANPRSIHRRLELFLLDAKYIIANTTECVDYRNIVVDTILDWLTVDLPSVSTELLERTSVYLYAKTTLADIKVKLGDNSYAYINPEQAFKLTFWLTTVAKRNKNLQTALTNTARSVLVDNLATNRVSVSKILADIRSKVADHIVDVECAGIGDDGEQYMFTVQDSYAAATLAKALALNPDGTIGIKDSVTVRFERHD